MPFHHFLTKNEKMTTLCTFLSIKDLSGKKIKIKDWSVTKKNKIEDLWSNFVSLKLVPFIYTEKEELVSMIGKFLET